MVKFIEIQWFMALKKWFLIGLFWGVALIAKNAPSETELLKKLSTSDNKADSIATLIDLSERYRFTQPDKGLKLAQKALNLSYVLSDTSLMIRSANKLAILEKENSITTCCVVTSRTSCKTCIMS